MSYQSSYIHQTRLGQAIKKLHMLGKRYGKTKEMAEQEDAVNGMAAMPGNMMASQAADLKARQARAALQKAAENKQLTDARAETEDTGNMSDDDYKQFRSDVDFIKSGSREQAPMPTAPDAAYDPYAASSAQLNVNKQAQLAPVNGSFTPQGLRNHTEETGRMVGDINTSKQLMKYGGMLNTLSDPRDVGGNF